MAKDAKNLMPAAAPTSERRCLSCGVALPRRRRRYCTMECQVNLLASLNRRTGLLRALNTRYATFYFTDLVIVMDVLLYGMEQIHSYILPRETGSKPVEDFRHLSNMLGNLWWGEKHRTNKRYLASKEVLEKARKRNAPLKAVMPTISTIPSVKSSSLIRLELDANDLTTSNLELKIKRAYRHQAMRHHPDVGGNGATFIKIREAYEKLIQWAMHPTFIQRRGFPDKWLYEGNRNRWLKPIEPRNKRKYSWH